MKSLMHPFRLSALFLVSLTALVAAKSPPAAPGKDKAKS